ncbi:MAG TPA: heavy metal-associated domain-containing protein [Pseudonocardia sp.]|jgi:copper chaperone CopZ
MSTNLTPSSTQSLTVDGMHCGHCASSVTKALRAVTGVTDITVDVPAGRVQVATDRHVPDAELERAVIDAGFDVVAAAGV